MGKLFGIRLDQKAFFAYYPKDEITSFQAKSGVSSKDSTAKGLPQEENPMEKKLILRRAYGFRNVENCRLRVCALCGEAGENRAGWMPRKPFASFLWGRASLVFLNVHLAG
ncbi:MAG: hypothetical protein IJE96_01445 [Mailhella sp.]|nr:hypothetical protein [Mailhella sp.]